jgi:hypothetical protein
MSDDILSAAERGRDYLQSPLDDLFSFSYTMQWAGAFQDQVFVGKDISFELEIWCENLLRDRKDRLDTTNQIILSLLTPLEYGSVLADCKPMLRDWYFRPRSIYRCSQHSL